MSVCRIHISLALASIVLLAQATACVGTGEGLPDAAPISGSIPETFQDIESNIFEPVCAAQCHHGGAAPRGLSLEHGRALSMLVGIPSVEDPSMLRVAPGQPDESYLIVKLVQYDARRLGKRMPFTGPPYLGDPQISALRRWIREGATEDWDGREGIEIDAGASDASSTDANTGG